MFVKGNKLATGTSEQKRTKAYFFEMAREKDKRFVIFKLKKSSESEHPWVYQAYMDMDDPTEYLFAEKYFDTWDDWERVTTVSWFIPHLEKMRRDLAKRNYARAVQALKLIALDPTDRNYYTANKYLSEIQVGFVVSEKKAKKNVGRPVKETPPPLLPSAVSINQDLARIRSILN